ncbi:MAG: glycine cleavage system protein GcvH [Candidatus Marinimicrobia bacterium]|nr:glycine cleavage system protein GcvH [Candidatus Neomarinimicrobiota bacterium]
MNLPTDIKYTQEHEWVKLDDKVAIIGITDYAQGELGDIVFVELPLIDEHFDKGESFGTVEAVKTVSDLYMPLSGKIIEVNEKLEDQPELINSDPYNDGWVIKLQLDSAEDNNNLIDSEKYKELIS